MEKEMEIIDQTENQETAEIEMLNARSKAHYDKMMQEHAEQISRQAEAEEYARKEAAKAEKAKARRKAYTMKSIFSVSALLVLSGAVAWAGQAEMIHPNIWMPTALICLCVACGRFGVWFGRVAKK